MNETTKTPVELLTALLAEMTERAIEAEQQRDKANESVDQWYRLYMNMETKLKEKETELNDQTKENEKLRAKIAELIENMEKGAQNND